MTDQVRLLGLSGSLRRDSFNTAMLRTAAKEVSPGVTLTVETLHGVPLYDADLEAIECLPERVATLKQAIVEADGVLLATPEYNNSMPGVFKNAIDWFSRPSDDIGRVFGGKPFALVGASPGGFGTIMSQAAWLPVLRTLGVRFWSEGRLLVSHAGKVIADGEVSDGATTKHLAAFVRDFASFAAATKSGAAKQR